MKKIFVTLFVALLCGHMAAQEARFAYCDTDSVLHSMPEYQEVLSQMAILRTQYAQEVEYNENDFHRQYSEFLEGQSNFPEPIFMKRQRDLQEAMEKSLAFRRECDALLRAAEKELLAPLQKRIDAAIESVGRTGGFAFILPSRPLYVNSTLCKDVTGRVIQNLKR